ncbi:hypothetical protein Y032_0197g1560 [Ancylostoma ceylanicum]|uniref:Uncharacterized protein n=1 Tax=Ancylostoma ceylanicum TaxID=53326 RepID=A0A016SP70_9BILA|nr:hypothetical protein Y032_0197g1560 [Ancylostoma ceylanicum]
MSMLLRSISTKLMIQVLATWGHDRRGRSDEQPAKLFAARSSHILSYNLCWIACWHENFSNVNSRDDSVTHELSNAHSSAGDSPILRCGLTPRPLVAYLALITACCRNVGQ